MKRFCLLLLATGCLALSLDSPAVAQNRWPEPAVLFPIPTDGAITSQVIQLCQHLPPLPQDDFYDPATMGPPVPHASANEHLLASPVVMQQPSHMPYESASESHHGEVYVQETCCNCWGSDERWIDNFSIFTGLEGSKQPQDFGVNAHFGGRVSTNAGFALNRDLGIGFQIGTSINATASAVQVLELLGITTGRTQSFTTIGLFQRTENGLVWGAAYDILYQQYTDSATLGQVRMRLGYQVSQSSEIGVRAMIGTQSAYDVDFGGVDVTLETIDQGHIYWRKFWASGGFTECWFGVAEGHSEANIVTGDGPPVDEQFVFGASFQQPLNNYLALYGEANLMMPADTGTVDAFLGFEFYPGGGSWVSQRNRYNPAFGVANNTSFAVNLFR